METKNGGCCCCGPSYVIACSGACDLGNIADQVARRLSAEGTRKMHCLAIVGAGIEKPTAELRDSNLLVIDGCEINCAKKIVDAADFMNYTYLRVSDLGFEKGKTEVSDSNIEEVRQVAAVYS